VPSIYDEIVDKNTPNNAHAFLVNMVGSNKRVLELGAASGSVTRALVQDGCKVTAIEYDAEAAADLKEVAHEAIVGDLNDPSWADSLTGDFDVVTAGDVLEHLLDPVGVLRRMVSLLNENGYVVISLPHIAHVDVRLSLLQGRFQYTPVGLLDHTHIRFFTLHSVKQLVADAGLVITELKRVRMPAFSSEQQVDPDSVSPEVLDSVLADPDAETYQFVFTAVRDGADQQLRALSERTVDVEGELEQARRELASARTEIQTLRNRTFDAETARDELVARRQVLRRKLKAEREALTAIRASRSYRYAAKLRRFFGG
jgi:2-polyprenyl-3-methyl-5-hydroxy-6-metoxy-1,4-benzoquinol methylase